MVKTLLSFRTISGKPKLAVPSLVSGLPALRIMALGHLPSNLHWASAHSAPGAARLLALALLVAAGGFSAAISAMGADPSAERKSSQAHHAASRHSARSVTKDGDATGQAEDLASDDPVEAGHDQATDQATDQAESDPNSEPSESVSDSPSSRSRESGPRFGPSGMTAEEMREAVIASQPVVDLPTDERSVALIDRFRARWDALIARDYSRAYAFEPPSVREQVTEEQFAGSFGYMVKWLGVEPFRVDYIDDDAADVAFILDYSFFLQLRGEEVKMDSHARERWIHEAGEWWHQPQSANITGTVPDGTVPEGSGQMP